MKDTLSEEQAPVLWQKAPERARRALLTMARLAVKLAAEQLKAEQETNQDGEPSG